jgi:uncharacterized tellurite resistance protein B-like protein
VRPLPLAFLLRLFGVAEADAEDESLRRIAARLDRLPPDRARFLAAFAYVLARVANADLRISDTERRAMERELARAADLGADDAALAVEVALAQERTLGGTDNYVVTREFRRLSGREERVRLLECLWAVAAADGTISASESAEIARIGEELGFLRAEVLALRAAWRDRLSELRDLPGRS